MTRSRAAVALAVAVATVVALVVGLSGSARPPRASDAALAPLVRRAQLEPCPGPLAAPGSPLPALRLPCLDQSGSRDLVGAPAGVPTLVNVYGSWCQPCAAEMPLLRELHELAGTKVRLVGIDTEDDPRQALLFAIDLRQHWPALRDDDGRVSRAFGGGAPKTLLVTSSGVLVHVQRGAYLSLAALRADVARYLGVRV